MAIDKSKILKSAEKYIASGKIANAVDEYLKVLKENPKDWNLKIQIGDLYLKVNKTQDAINLFTDVADHYAHDGFFLKAIAIYKRINKLDPNLTEICMKLADLYLKQGLTMDAKTQLQVVAQHYVSKNQTKDAIQTLKKLIEIEPDNLRSRNELAKAYKNEGMVVEAVREYLEISDELIRKNLLKESLAVLETAVKLDSRNVDILRKILSVYSEQNETAKAISLLEEALKQDPSNAQVLGLLAETCANTKQFDRAHQIIDRAIAGAMDKEPLWTHKGDIFLKEGDLIEAFSQYEKVVDQMVRRKELDRAVVLMQRITRVDPSFHPALQRMVDYYTALKQESNMIGAYNSLIDAYISKTMYPEAADYLERLIRLEPDNAQHQEKLEFVRSFLEKPKPAPPAPPPAVIHAPEPIPELDLPEEVSGGDFDLDISIDLGQPMISVPAPEPPKPPPPPPPPSEPPKPRPAPVAPAAAEGSDDEKEFVSEHMIEAEVFTKYGLIDKAIEQLQMITHRFANSVLARQKLKEIYLEKGDRDNAVEECVAMSRIFRKQGDLDQAEDLLSEARQIDPNHSSLDHAFKEIPVVEVPHPVAPVTPTPSSASRTDLSRAKVMSEIEKLAQSVKGRPSTAKAAPKHPVAPKPAPEAPRPSPPPPPPPPPQPVETIPAPPEILIEVEEPEPETGPMEVPGVLGPEKFEEIDFYTSQGLMSEAHRLLSDLRKMYPEDPGVLSRLSQFEEVTVSPVDLIVETPEEIAAAPEGEPPPELLHAQLVEPEPQEIPQEQLPEPELEEISLEQLQESQAKEIMQEEVAVQEISLEPEVQEISLEQLQQSEIQMEELPAEITEIEEPEIIEMVTEGPAPVEPEVVAEVSLEAPVAEAEAEPEVIPPVEPAVEVDLAHTLDISDVGELTLEPESLSDAPTEPAIVVNPFEGNVSEEPASEALSAPPVDFGEIAELAEQVVSGPEEEQVPEQVPSVPAEPLAVAEPEFPAERSLDDALDAAFLGDESPVEETKPVQASQELFEEEDDFFDLAAELEEGFLNVQSAVEEERPADGQNYSIEEILTDFKKGVEKQLGAEDYDTRYNLGIAYKEMGLVDEAIAEFQIASKDDKRFLECCSMLGLCFLEKGMPKLALKWYQRGMETTGHGEDEYLGLRFDMAAAYEALGEDDKALECYQEVYGANAGYRNVTKKIKELQQQLKK